MIREGGVGGETTARNLTESEQDALAKRREVGGGDKCDRIIPRRTGLFDIWWSGCKRWRRLRVCCC